MTKITNYEWLKERVGYNGAHCLFWPFARDHQGRGLVGVGNRKIRKAHRVMCELVNGAPPSPEYQAAHECGNGHLGCVHPKHLTWKTQSGNTIDRIRHGRGIGNPGGSRTLFSAIEIEQLRADILAGEMTVMDMSRKFRRPRSVIQFWKGRFRGNPNFVVKQPRGRRAA